MSVAGGEEGGGPLALEMLAPIHLRLGVTPGALFSEGGSENIPLVASSLERGLYLGSVMPPHLPHEVARIMNPILQKEKLRLEEESSL